MLTEKNILHSEIHAFIGNQKNTEQFKLISLQLASDKIGGSQHLLTQQPTWFRYIDATNLPMTTHDFLTAHLRNGKTTTLPYIAFFGTQRTTSPIEKTENLQGGVVLYFDENQHIEKAYYIPSRGWNSLAIRLFFGNVGKPHFVPVYPLHGFSIAPIKVWEIRYPEDTVSNPEYLLTDFEVKNR